MPAVADELEHRSRPRNTMRPDVLTRGLSAATAGLGRARPGGCHGALEFLSESEEKAEDDEEMRVRNGWAAHGASRCLRGTSAAELLLLSPVYFLDMRWIRLATGAERVRNGERNSCGGRRAFLPKMHDEVDDEARERNDSLSHDPSSHRSWVWLEPDPKSG
ncbi:hypothetical protein E2562_037509 [Oryza meyeriana var. granulata]|uniref:Uncharacterized protein n=1 Tax=Oryza meyeriana var. granulata TaxID=110450 RepID=A0A6G1E6Y4_9ORYZ|nr:hypothetical protein E2562_037509 [Oryza meyeriana var. granulata]